MVSSEDFLLLVRGYLEDESPLHVVAKSSTMALSAFCTVHKAELGAVCFWVGKSKDGAISFDISECFFDFGDVPDGLVDLPTGRQAESGLVAIRLEDGFELYIILLKA